MEDGAEVDCPYCGESLWIPVDPTGGSSQRFVTDCEVCCRPIEIAAEVDRDGFIRVAATTEDAST